VTTNFALNQLLISVNVPFMSFIKFVVLDLVMMKIVSSANKIHLELLLLSLVLVIFIIL